MRFQLPREFLAVVLAGFGNQLFPLTNDYGEQPCPKALLPVANKPVLDYVLTWVEQSGIKDVLLICPAIHRASIYHHIHSDSSVPVASLRIDLQTYDETQDTSIGTCTLLRHFSNRIKEDFVLLPCDFIPPATLPLSILLNKFRADAISDGAIATACWYAGHKPDKGAYPEEWGPHTTNIPIIWDEPTGTLLYIDTADDQERNSEDLELRMSLFSRYPRTRLSTGFQDSHVYVCRRSILDALHEKKHLDSFKEEFMPWLCKVQYQRGKRSRYGRRLNASSTTSQSLALGHTTLLSKVPGLKSSEPYGSNNGEPSLSENHDSSSSLRIGIIIHHAASGFAIRANTLFAFQELNRRSLLDAAYSLPSDPKNRDSIIGDSTQISERTVVKKSVIGRHCVIGKNGQIVGCILLDHCVIEDGAKLDGCILGMNTKVRAKAEVSRCVTQAGEKLEVSDWTAGGSDEGSSEEE
ncbi:UDP-3-O-glucosamine N-acyltransferase [Infundibulicybe gibba]|nr:UDP-3-O-glucosamine N-acyltransferase [Infundibulicybe gibba]